MCVCVSAVVVTLEPLVGAETYVNGKRITDGVALKQGDFFLFSFMCFYFRGSEWETSVLFTAVQTLQYILPSLILNSEHILIIFQHTSACKHFDSPLSCE